ncbi:hypothetical protein GCM10010372_83290 [Streptomyces tauricus]|uniref:DUF397 domain-containing protein n=1 Tax=Streptomyces tauricus TaxID=68274 RepID=UPI001677A15F|nr:DUF397 domain-containing protein [Streptomyces tauricus]GHA71686.1 hypothetical protein GCM10010372_83290 [Streptomyces tauricus]
MSVEQASENVDGLRWFKSSYSGSGGGNCVEVAAKSDAVFVRDSKVVGDGPVLRVRRGQWGAFIAFAVG